MSTTTKELLAVKLVILIGLISAHYLPTDHALMVNAFSNALWLFRT